MLSKLTLVTLMETEYSYITTEADVKCNLLILITCFCFK